MPFQKGQPRPAGAGRKKGQTSEVLATLRMGVEEQCAAVGCNPFTGMALIAIDERYPVEVRLAAMRALAKYIKPERKAIEVSGTVLDLNVHVSAADLLRAKLDQLASRAARITDGGTAGGNIPGAD